MCTGGRASADLVHDNMGDGSQGGVPSQTAQQDAGGAEQQAGVPGRRRIQPNVVAHLYDSRVRRLVNLGKLASRAVLDVPYEHLRV